MINNESKKEYAFDFNNVLRLANETLNGNDFKLYLNIAYKCNVNGNSWKHSDSTWMKELNLSKTSFYRSKKYLEENAYIIILNKGKKNGHNSNEVTDYTINTLKFNSNSDNMDSVKITPTTKNGTTTSYQIGSTLLPNWEYPPTKNGTHINEDKKEIINDMNNDNTIVHDYESGKHSIDDNLNKIDNSSTDKTDNSSVEQTQLKAYNSSISKTDNSSIDEASNSSIKSVGKTDNSNANKTDNSSVKQTQLKAYNSSVKHSAYFNKLKIELDNIYKSNTIQQFKQTQRAYIKLYDDTYTELNDTEHTQINNNYNSILNAKSKYFKKPIYDLDIPTKESDLMIEELSGNMNVGGFEKPKPREKTEFEKVIDYVYSQPIFS